MMANNKAFEELTDYQKYLLKREIIHVFEKMFFHQIRFIKEEEIEAAFNELVEIYEPFKNSVFNGMDAERAVERIVIRKMYGESAFE